MKKNLNKVCKTCLIPYFGKGIKYCSRKCMSLGQRGSNNPYKGSGKGNKNGMWKGDDAGYVALHLWVNSNWKKEKICEECRTKNNVQLANVTGVYKRDFSNWKYLCSKCHYKHDGQYLRKRDWHGRYIKKCYA